MFRRLSPLTTALALPLCLVAADAARAAEFTAHHAFIASPETNQVFELDEDLNFVRTISAPGLAIPHALAFGPDGLLYVGSATKRVFVFDATGAVVRDFDVQSGPAGLAFGPGGNLYATGDEKLRAFVLTQDPPEPSPVDLVEDVAGLAFGADGRIYVAAPQSDAFLRITPELTRSGLLDPGLGPHDLEVPEAIVLGPRGRFFTTDFVTDEVVEWTGAGLAVDSIPLGGLKDPDGLAFDRAGRLWVTSNGGDEIALVDVESEQVQRVDLAPLGLLRPAAVAFAPVRFLAKVKGKLVHADGTVEKIAEDVELSWAPGSQRTSIRLLDLTNGATLFDRFFSAAWVMHGEELGGPGAEKRVLDQVEIHAFAQSRGISRVVLKAKGDLVGAGRYEPKKLSGTIHRSAASITFSGKISTKARLD